MAGYDPGGSYFTGSSSNLTPAQTQQAISASQQYYVSPAISDKLKRSIATYTGSYGQDTPEAHQAVYELMRRDGLEGWALDQSMGWPIGTTDALAASYGWPGLDGVKVRPSGVDASGSWVYDYGYGQTPPPNGQTPPGMPDQQYYVPPAILDKLTRAIATYTGSYGHDTPEAHQAVYELMRRDGLEGWALDQAMGWEIGTTDALAASYGWPGLDGVKVKPSGVDASGKWVYDYGYGQTPPPNQPSVGDALPPTYQTPPPNQPSVGDALPPMYQTPTSVGDALPPMYQTPTSVGDALPPMYQTLPPTQPWAGGLGSHQPSGGGLGSQTPTSVGDALPPMYQTPPPIQPLGGGLGSQTPPPIGAAPPNATDIQQFIRANADKPELIYNQAAESGLTGHDLDYAMGWAPGSADAFAKARGWPVLTGSPEQFNPYTVSTYSAPSVGSQGYNATNAQAYGYDATHANASTYDAAQAATQTYDAARWDGDVASYDAAQAATQTYDAARWAGDVASYDAAQAATQIYNAAQGQVTPQGYVEDRLSGLLTRGNPLLDAVQQQAMEAYAGRGMVNSSDAINSALRAVMSQGTQIAGTDAAAYNQQSLVNQAALNEQRQFNAGALNNTSQFNANLLNQAYAEEAAAQNQQSLVNQAALNEQRQFNAGALNNTSQFNANLLNQAYAENAAAQNQASMYNASADNTAAAAYATAQNQASLQNASNATAASQFGAAAANNAALANQAAQLQAERDNANALNASTALAQQQTFEAFQLHRAELQAALDRGEDASQNAQQMVLDMLDRGVFAPDANGSMQTTYDFLNYLHTVDPAGNWAQSAAYLIELQDSDSPGATGMLGGMQGLPPGASADSRYNT
jgi:hypothetical protein